MAFFFFCCVQLKRGSVSATLL
ncbi:MAG: hypothetical protein LBU32_06370 [Clostridiales bacterium]|nr:hypothetical protein [Clostridiales bacterium]